MDAKQNNPDQLFVIPADCGGISIDALIVALDRASGGVEALTVLGMYDGRFELHHAGIMKLLWSVEGSLHQLRTMLNFMSSQPAANDA